MWERTLTFTLVISMYTKGNAADTANIVSTQGCTIPRFPLFSENIRQFVEPDFDVKPNCTEFVPLLKFNASHIWVEKDAYILFEIWNPNNFYCCYKNFSADKHVENVAYGECIEFKNRIIAQHKFVRVECYYMDNKIYDDFFLFHIDLESPSWSQTGYYEASSGKNQLPKKEEKSFNILMLGFESMSRLNFIRSMPKTAKYLKNKGSIQLLGYNKLGDNSYPNLFPLLTGKSFQDVKRDCEPNRVFDTRKCPFVWDLFKRKEYSTALGADSSAGLLGIYEYVLPKIPTDFYLQPFMYETRFLFKDRTYDFHLCLRDRYYYTVLLQYIRSVTFDAKKRKFFGVFWEESVSHAHLNYNHIMDHNYVNLLRELEMSDFLDNTILVLFSDHGTRFGKMVETDQGRYESRLPLFEMLLPPRFRRSHKFAYKNLKSNSQRLTTPFDVHQTLLDLADVTSLNNRNIKQRTQSLNLNSSAISLFLSIPESRTCRSIGISQRWCTCRFGDKAVVDNKTKMFASHYLVNYINKIIKDFPQCYRLEFEKIIDVSMMNQSHSLVYTVVVQLSPGPALFEGTLVAEGGLWAVVEDVSRLNLYRDQSHCIHDNKIKPYCICKQ